MPRRSVAALALLLAVGACGERVETRVLHRSGCEVCHRPLNSDGVPEGIEDAHPGAPLSCTDCHGGNAYVCDGQLDMSGSEPRCDGTWVYDQDRAHPNPAGSPEHLRDLHAGQLDDVDRDWLRFVNPGDLRVLSDTCGGCHTAEAAAVRRSAHAHTAGELAVARFRAGKQAAPTPAFGAASVFDSNAASGGACAAVAVNPFDPLVIDVSSDDPLDAPTVANAQEHLLAKACIGCHIQDFGRNDAPGTYRSSGCTACHIAYAEDGRSRSLDPWIDKQTPPHPIAHRLEAAAPTSTCTACHHDGARIGLSYRGMRDPAGPDWESPHVATLDRPLYGHPAGHYVTDEDTRNDFDETPPDVHFEAGMDCVDCHTRFDLHGDGHLYGDAACVVRTSCEDCHGTVREAAAPSARRDNLFRGDDGGLWLRTKRTGIELRVPQVVDALTPGHPAYSPLAVQAKGVDAAGWSHSDTLECVTCHASWMPSCYGCHVEIDLTAGAADLLSGNLEPGAPHATPMGVQTNDLVLLWDQHGKLAPSMPAERMFYTLLAQGPGDEPVPRFANAPRAFGQRPIDPHTTRRRSQFMACDRCHSAGDVDDPDNAALLDLTHGFGTARFDVTACDPAAGDGQCGPGAPQGVYRLDAVLTSDGRPLVEVGHPFPEVARPLTLDEIARMRAVRVPDDAPWSTPAPTDASDLRWPPAQPLE